MNVRKNLNIYTEKNLNLTTKIALLYRNLYQIQSQKILILSQVIWISLNFMKKIWMGGRSGICEGTRLNDAEA